MRSTSCTPSITSISAESTLCAPTTPSTVRLTPVDRCTSIPASTSDATTFSICASVARSSMTTTMAIRPLPVPCRGLPAAGYELCALDAPRLVDNPFEHPHDGVPFERAACLLAVGAHVVQHLLLPLGLIHLEPECLLQLPDFERAVRALVEQFDQPFVELIDPLPELVDCHLCAGHKSSSGLRCRRGPTVCVAVRWTRRLSASERKILPFRSDPGLFPASAMTATSPLPTTAASANLPICRTCSGDEMPKPKAIGSDVAALMRPARASAPSATVSRVPVTPSREMPYRNPRPSLRRLPDARVGRRRAQQKDHVDLPRRHRVAKAAGLFDRQVQHEHAIDSGLARAIAEGLHAHPQDRVGVGEQHDGRLSRPAARVPPDRARPPQSRQPPARARSRAE